MASAISDEPVVQLQGMERSLRALTAKQVAPLVRSLGVQVSALAPVLADNIKAMQEGEMFGQTLQRAQVKALQEFSAAIHSISEGLQPGSAPPLTEPPSTGSTSGAGRGAAPRPLFPPDAGCGPASPEAFYRVREAFASALKALAAAFKPSHPGLARAIKGVLDDVEETGLFD